MAGYLENIGEGCLYLSSDGQGLDVLKKDPVVIENRPPPVGSGFDTAYISRYEGTDFVQWHGRRSDGMFHPWGKIMRLTKEGLAALEGE